MYINKGKFFILILFLIFWFTMWSIAIGDENKQYTMNDMIKFDEVVVLVVDGTKTFQNSPLIQNFKNPILKQRYGNKVEFWTIRGDHFPDYCQRLNISRLPVMLKFDKMNGEFYEVRRTPVLNSLQNILQFMAGTRQDLPIQPPPGGG